MTRAENPFASCYTDPVLANYIFHPDNPLETYLHILEHHRWTAALCGPHGVGKTTLLHTLARQAALRGKAALVVKCSPRTGLPPPSIWRIFNSDVLFLDSAENLRPPILHFIRVLARLLRKGLVVTVHSPCIIRPNVPVSSSPAQFLAVVSRLTNNQTSMAAAQEALNQNRGNARQALFTLYDDYETSSQSL